MSPVGQAHSQGLPKHNKSKYFDSTNSFFTIATMVVQKKQLTSIPFGSTLFRHNSCFVFQFSKHLIWLRIIDCDKRSMPETRVVSILFKIVSYSKTVYLSNRLLVEFVYIFSFAYHSRNPSITLDFGTILIHVIISLNLL